VAVGQGHQELRTTLAELIADFEFIQRDRIMQKRQSVSK
jgi:hypothetical protein